MFMMISREVKHASSNRVKPKFKAFLYWSVLYKFTVKCDRHEVWTVLGPRPLVSYNISTAPVKKRFFMCIEILQVYQHYIYYSLLMLTSFRSKSFIFSLTSIQHENIYPFMLNWKIILKALRCQCMLQWNNNSYMYFLATKISLTRVVRKVRGQPWEKLRNIGTMYETDIFVTFKFRFIGMQNKVQIVITLSHTKSTHTYTRSIEMNFWRNMTSNTPPRLILLHINCLDNLYSLCKIFIGQNSRHLNF
jgi:hypothetical protein